MFEKLNALAQRMDELEARLAEPGLYDDPERAAKLLKERNELEPIVAAFRAYEQAKQAQEDALEMLSDPDMKELAQEELQQAGPTSRGSRTNSRSFCCPATRTTRKTFSWKYAAAQVARKARCLPPTCTACTPCTRTSAAGRPRS